MTDAYRKVIVQSAVAESNSADAVEFDSRLSSERLVTFTRSGKTVPWTGESSSLLEFSEAHGVDISFGCRYGDCGTCMTRLIRGTVQYLHPTGASPDPGTCLPCSCKPETDVELDA